MIIDLKKNNLSILEALKIAKSGDELILDDKIYKEKIIINTPNLTFKGTKNTKITFDNCSSDIIPEKFGGDGIKTFGTTGSATFTVAKEASFFKAYNIIFENSYKRIGKMHSQAVAFKSEADNIYLNNCTFLSHQDTLYIDYGKNNEIISSKIYGDIDFIFGSADCFFKNCEIYALNDEIDHAYYTAPSTYICNNNGFIFNNCNFYTKPNMEVYLGRPWYPSKALMEVIPRISFINCSFSKDINLSLKQMHEGDPDNYIFEIRQE